MKDQPHGGVFGGYGFMRYTSPQNGQSSPRQSSAPAHQPATGFAAAAQRLLARWMRR